MQWQSYILILTINNKSNFGKLLYFINFYLFIVFFKYAIAHLIYDSTQNKCATRNYMFALRIYNHIKKKLKITIFNQILQF